MTGESHDTLIIKNKIVLMTGARWGLGAAIAPSSRPMMESSLDVIEKSGLMPWFVKIERGIVAKTQFDRYVSAHKQYVQTLIQQGHEAKTGYWAEYGGGMLLFKADSWAQAEQIVAQDPLVLHHCVEYELHEWCLVVS